MKPVTIEDVNIMELGLGRSMEPLTSMNFSNSF
jgi:hypothetical protein